jgi:hypothetical protein
MTMVSSRAKTLQLAFSFVTLRAQRETDSMVKLSIQQPLATEAANIYHGELLPCDSALTNGSSTSSMS